jgi:DNA polymerase-3 subunit epsilon
MAHILESTEIKKLWPVFNSSQKRWEDVYGIFSYTDQNGFLRLAIEKNKSRLNPIHSFHYIVDGHAIMRKLVREYELCPKLCFIQTDTQPCDGIQEGYCHGACEHKEDIELYNERVQLAINSLRSSPSYAIVEKGLNGSDQSCVLVWQGKFYGMGYIPEDLVIAESESESIKQYITPYKENSFIRNLVNGYAARFPEKVKTLS